LFIHNFKEAEHIWINPLNKELYKILFNKCQHIKDPNKEAIDEFYVAVWNEFKETNDDLKLEIYTEVYQKEFNFFETMENYLDFVFRKSILSELEQLKSMIENDFIIDQGKLVRLKKMLDLGLYYYE